MNLSKRMKEIIKYVKKNSLVADIGTDHGYIPIHLIENKISKKVIATDLNKGPLSKIEKSVKSKNLEDYIDIRLGDGLEPVKNFEVDTVIIAGMGGVLIRDILDKERKKTNSFVNFILQPNTASDKLREYLLENNFTIVDEKLVKENNLFYEILYVKEGKEKLPDYEFYEIGERLVENKDPLLEEFILEKIAENKKILDRIKNLTGPGVDVRRDKIKRKIVYFEEVYRRV